MHFEDIRRLLEVLQRLVAGGNTVLVIEHNLDVIKCADHVIDLGPEGGIAGGEIVVTGTPEDVARCERSATSFICGVICPARAKSICVTSLGSVCVLIGTAPFVGITHIRFAGQGGRAQSQPAVLSCKLPVMSWAQV